MKFAMEDGSVVDTERATARYQEARDWDGRNHISRATGSQWVHETLYRSAKGRWYIVTRSQWEGSLPRARYVTPAEAASWLILNEHPVPDELRAEAEKLVE